MVIREQTEQLEHQILHPLASFSDMSRGRDRYDAPCDIRTVYQRDRDRILHSKSFRRLKHKTQVFLSPRGDHYRTRLTHTLEVAQLSRTIAKALRMNEDLVDAIALGHDLGHTPFGHAGERALDEICPYGFSHAMQSVRIVETLEKGGRGLNLTWEVRDGIRNHQTSGHPHTMEGRIVRYCDKIAYINHDIDDAMRAGILKLQDIPEHFTREMGETSRERLNTLIHDVIVTSQREETITMSPHMEELMIALRKFMFAAVYTNPAAKSEEKKVSHLLQELYKYYLDHIPEMPEEYPRLISQCQEKPEIVVCDYIAGMTDQYAVQRFNELFVPLSWQPY